MMVFISVFLVTFGVEVQSLAVIGVTFTSFVFHYFSNPFEEKSMNAMELRALVSATLTLYGGLYFITGIE